MERNILPIESVFSRTVSCSVMENSRISASGKKRYPSVRTASSASTEVKMISAAGFDAFFIHPRVIPPANGRISIKIRMRLFINSNTPHSRLIPFSRIRTSGSAITPISILIAIRQKAETVNARCWRMLTRETSLFSFGV